jgi:biotin carboxylase
MKKLPLRACIVDAHSSAQQFAPAFRERGIETVHIQSRDPIPHRWQPFDGSVHVDNIVHAGDLEATAQRVLEHRPLCVIPGTDTGVMLADALTERLGLASNGTTLSKARRDKFAMHKTLERAGVRAIPSLLSSDWSEIEAWIGRLGRFPVVLKPSDSGGTDFVFVAKTLQEAHEAFTTILGATSYFETIIDKVLVQEFIAGTEYLMNTVSVAGHHFMTDWWSLDKVVDGNPIYEYGRLEPLRSELQRSVFAYVCSVLDALGVRFGPVHTELMLTPEGPILIEVNCRVIGAKLQIPIAAVLGYSDISVTIDAYTDPARFFARMNGPVPAITRQLSRVDLISPKTGTLTGLPRLDDVRALRSFFQVGSYVKIGGNLQRTIDLFTCPGFVDLIHEDPAVIHDDYQRIRAWEAADFYQVKE